MKAKINENSVKLMKAFSKNSKRLGIWQKNNKNCDVQKKKSLQKSFPYK